MESSFPESEDDTEHVFLSSELLSRYAVILCIQIRLHTFKNGS
jgi:hypothetical protein